MSAEPFSKNSWAAGCLLALAGGSILNMGMISIGLKINITAVATVLGLIPGVVLIVLARRSPRREFGLGMLVGACVIAILGGACAAIFTATQVK